MKHFIAGFFQRFAAVGTIGVLVLKTSIVNAAPAQAPSHSTAPEQTVPVMELRLRPMRNGESDITFIDVREELSNLLTKESATFSIRAPIIYASVTGIAERIQNLEVRDASGIVPLKTQDDPANRGGFPYYRHWRANRPIVYPATITYHSLPQATPPVVGPQFSFRAHDGGLSGAGSGFLALPENNGISLTHVKWDLSDLNPQSKAATTFGDGDFELAGDPQRLTQGYFMAGPIGEYKVPGKENKFTGYWLGTPAFDPQKELAWAAKCYAYQSDFFRKSSAAPEYRMFIRAVPGVKAFSGTALQNSFMMAVAPGAGDPSLVGPRPKMAHEMQHMFTGNSAGPNAGPWFEEGLTEYYTYLLLRRAGLESIDEYTSAVNDIAARYYSNPYRNATLAALSGTGFSTGVGGTSAQNVSYTKGFLYFATVDSKIRTASGGKRKLDDVILNLFEKRRQGELFDVPTLIAAFEKEYGASAKTDFESAIVRGETIEPPSGAFGPGFERREKTYRSEGKDVSGFEWIRLPTVTDEQCRAW
jgi:hypothetical protein